MGHVLTDGTNTFSYNNAGRLASAANSSGTTTYTYNALGQRVRKVTPSGTTYFVYDEVGHLIGEYDANVNLIEEVVWLGDTPVASIRPGQNGGVGIFYIHTDSLNAPTRLTRANDNTVVWRWDHDPYGNGAATQDPDGNGAIVVFNLRFPGQYYDSETGLNYNYQRDYDPSVGRYVESDPLGLLGGGYSTYSYAFGNPLSASDPTGKFGVVWAAIGFVGGAVAGYAVNGWVGAFVGGAVGVVVGAVAAPLAAEAGAAVAAYLGGGAGVLAEAGTFAALNGAGAVLSQAGTNKALGEPVTQGTGQAAAVAATASLGEGFFLAFGGDAFPILSGVFAGISGIAAAEGAFLDPASLNGLPAINSRAKQCAR